MNSEFELQTRELSVSSEPFRADLILYWNWNVRRVVEHLLYLLWTRYNKTVRFVGFVTRS
jgi:hypothetical protein